MEKSTVVSLYIAPGARQPTVSVNEVHAVPGKGLEGDRYFNLTGTFCDNPGPSYEVTLIEIEAVDALKRDCKVELSAGEIRRNIVTRGVALNHLVGREFKVGSVSLRGIRLCEPCAHLEKLTRDGVISGLTHRGGLRAQVLTEGAIRVGDPVCEA
ncbi:MAG TPA: MOSC domain-containing protein [Terriglobia bacterium]|nr:MOSC domain-containing protein [Terriglobia bacterium]